MTQKLQCECGSMSFYQELCQGAYSLLACAKCKMVYMAQHKLNRKETYTTMTAHPTNLPFEEYLPPVFRNEEWSIDAKLGVPVMFAQCSCQSYKWTAIDTMMKKPTIPGAAVCTHCGKIYEREQDALWDTGNKTEEPRNKGEIVQMKVFGKTNSILDSIIKQP